MVIVPPTGAQGSHRRVETSQRTTFLQIAHILDELQCGVYGLPEGPASEACLWYAAQDRVFVFAADEPIYIAAVSECETGRQWTCDT